MAIFGYKWPIESVIKAESENGRKTYIFEISEYNHGSLSSRMSKISLMMSCEAFKNWSTLNLCSVATL